jgi:hypothetical protein
MFPRQTKRTDTGLTEDVDIVPACDSAVAFLAVMVALVRQVRRFRVAVRTFGVAPRHGPLLRQEQVRITVTAITT